MAAAAVTTLCMRIPVVLSDVQCPGAALAGPARPSCQIESQLSKEWCLDVLLITHVGLGDKNVA
jgi:hypothetical protein